MRSKALFALLLGAAANGSACAMTSTSPQAISCSVEGKDKLPPEIGGEEGICTAIGSAALPALQSAGIAPASFAVAVSVTSEHGMSATASVNGRALPEQKVGISDRPLNARAVQMLAAAVAGELEKLGK